MADVRFSLSGFLIKSGISIALILGLLKLSTYKAQDMVEVNSTDPITYQALGLPDGNIYKFFRNNKKLSYKEGLDLLEGSKEFRSLIAHKIAKQEFAAVFWEFPPLSKKSEPNFEFVLNNARMLSTVKADKTTFRSYFKPGCTVTTFPNLGGDANLVVPCLTSTKTNYAHLASFMRTAPQDQIHELLTTTAQQVKQWLENSDSIVWLSTSGAGVFYLHVRLDSYPKYYTYRPYKNAKYEGI